MVGNTISHYKIIEKLGEGGMGVVYKAEDTRLRRVVSLKFPPKDLWCDEEARSRFTHEARIASVLNHPNIATIHEIDEVEGQCFIAMEYIEGKSLKALLEDKILSVSEVLKIAIQIAEGLVAAHKKGIVHRDIKPENIMITGDGRAKIMDFGLATLKGMSDLTKPGATVGTVAYMSPEQIRGDSVDQRADVWSFGIVLYEMLTGKRPFGGEYEQAVVYSILNSAPESMAHVGVGLPQKLEEVVKKALAKGTDSRYQNVSHMLVDLKELAWTLEHPVPNERGLADRVQASVAVLPFANLSAEKEQEYFCDGVAEEIISALTHVEALRVVARTSSFAFKGRSEDVREIGRKLNVTVVLEGSVRKVGNRLRITALLVNASDGYHLWSEQYDREMEDVFAIQDDIALTIVEKLKVRLFGKEKAAIAKRPTRNVEAYSLYLKGRYYWNKRTLENLKKAVDLFEQAAEKDPEYALAYVGVADSYNILSAFLPASESFPRAEAAALKALELDVTLAEAYASVAYVSRNYHWDWASAEKQYRKSIQINPGYATAHHWYAMHLTAMGTHDEAMKEIELAQQLDPLSPIINLGVGNVFYFARQYDKALEQCLKLLEMDPKFALAHYRIGFTYVQLRKHEQALREFYEASALFSGDPELSWTYGYAHAVAGRSNAAMKVLAELEELSKQKHVPPHVFALIYIGLGQTDQALEWLDRAYEERDADIVLLKVEPAYDSIRSDPRFQKLLKKLGLEK